METRLLVWLFGVLTLPVHLVAAPPSPQERLIRATYRLDHPRTSGTGFVVTRSDPTDEGSSETLLVTTAHAFEKMDGGKLMVGLREQGAEAEWSAAPLEVPIRQNGRTLWHRHPDLDVAVLPLPDTIEPESIPLEFLADARHWESMPPEPGALVRCVGFPHAAQFKPSEAGFPLSRLGCVASYPVVPFERYPTFLVDYNTFEGDSGGPVYLEIRGDKGSRVKVIGLVQAQHFIDERYELVYQKGQIRKRLGLAIIVNSQAILETIETMPADRG